MALWKSLRQKEKPQNEAGEAEAPLSPPDPTDPHLDTLESLIGPGDRGENRGDRSRAHCGPLQGKDLFKG